MVLVRFGFPSSAFTNSNGAPTPKILGCGYAALGSPVQNSFFARFCSTSSVTHGQDSPEAAKKDSFNQEIAKISKKGIQVPYRGLASFERHGQLIPCLEQAHLLWDLCELLFKTLSLRAFVELVPGLAHNQNLDQYYAPLMRVEWTASWEFDGRNEDFFFRGGSLAYSFSAHPSDTPGRNFS
jgi:hypothetical protein